MAIFRYFVGFAALGLLALAPASNAKVIDESETGFTVAHTAQVAASPDQL